MNESDIDSHVQEKNSYHYLIITTLKKEGRSMTAPQLLKEIKKHKKITGKTPDATIRSILQRSSYIARIGKGRYNLKSRIKIPKL